MFQDFIFEAELLEIGLRGDEYTWKQGRILKRLDWCLFNEGCAKLFPMALVTHLARVGFNHCPLLFHAPKLSGRAEDRPFCFIAAWQEHPDFANLVREEWEDKLNVLANIEIFKLKNLKRNLMKFWHKRKAYGCKNHDSNGDPQWIPPPSAWVKTNVDGSRDIQDGYAACGRAIRDSNGNWLIGFAKAVGICSVLEAELWGEFEGLLHAWRLGKRQAILETDSADAYRLLIRNSPKVASPTIIMHILELLERQWKVEIKHIRRDANKIADSLATMAQKKEFAGLIFETPPEAILSILQEDGAMMRL
ncbi:hypothetical protein F3Y22_tig00110676pilonHSYRG00016 [Hibiscus syriacus]|uniref:RNase H type-1 domain-containing protein n=1 Tax=Hibiscus syriacus TaxID=106335 RepID=A0A6A2ZWV0_HIBSY|nr:hypothetical protein F3Y22_tig00110676pilonHSYRG00016 [Hibiscus syriacus]